MAKKAGVIDEIISREAIEGIKTATINLETLATTMAKVKPVNLTGAGSGGNQAKEYDELTKQIAAQEKAIQKYQIQLSLVNSERQKEIERLKELNKQEQTNRDLKAAADGSLKQTQLLIKQLTKEYDALSKAQREAAGGQDLRAKLSSLNTLYREQKVAISDMKANVGNYADSLKGMKVQLMQGKETMNAFGETTNRVTGILGSLGGSSSAAMGAMSKLTQGFSMLGGLLMGGTIGLAIGAIAAAIWGVSKAAEAWQARNDEIYDQHIKFLQQLGELKTKLKEYQDYFTEAADIRSGSEKKFAEMNLKKIQAEELINKQYADRVKYLKEQLPIMVEMYNREGQFEKAGQQRKLTEEEIAQAEKDRNSALEKLNQQYGTSIKLTAATAAAKDPLINKLGQENDVVGELIGAYLKLRNAQGIPVGPTESAPIEGVPTLPGSVSSPGTGINPQKIQQSSSMPGMQTGNEIQQLEMEKWSARLQIASEFTAQLTALSDAFYQNEINHITEEQTALQSAKEKELEAAGNSKKKQDEINKKYRKKEEALEKEKKKALHDQAVMQKALAVVQAIVNTAVGVTAQLGIMGAGPVLAAIVAAMGAIEIATILAQSVPSYAKGRKGGPAEFARVSEQGQEGRLTKEGILYPLPAHESIVALGEGDSVLRHDEYMRAIQAATSPKYNATATVTGQELADYTGFMMVVDAIRNRPEKGVIMDANGIRQYLRNGNNYYEYMNNNVRL